MARTSATHGKSRSKLTVIIDLAGLTMRHASSSTLAVLKQRTRLEEDNYPEVVRRCILINAPSLFLATWPVVRHFLDDGTAAKFSILGADYLPTLLQHIEPSAIPAYLGGTLHDSSGSPDCRLLIGPGGTVPHAVTLGVANDALGDGEEVVVPAGAATDVLLRLPAGARAFWRWASVEKDVTFSAVAVPEAAGAAAATAVAPKSSICGVHQLATGYSPAQPDAPPPTPAHAPKADTKAPALAGEAVIQAPARLHRSDGEFTAAAGAGDTLLRLRWDNSSSWVTGKHIVRRVDVLLPGDGATLADAVAAGRCRVESEPALRLDGYARARREHMDTYGLPTSTVWQTTSLKLQPQAAE